MLKALGLDQYINKCALAYKAGDLASFVAGFSGLIKGIGKAGLKGAAKSCPNSFSADTPVATEQGLRPISTIKIGDLVWAYNEQTGTTGLYTVTALIFHYDPAILHLSIDGELVQTTAEHPFFTQEQGWVDARKLWPGAHVRKLNGHYGVVQGVEVVQQGQTMYNLTVAQAHTFFVGQAQWLVHNSKFCNSPAESPIWKELSSYKGKTKKSGSGRDTQYYEWDHTHGDIEVYNTKGVHRGSMNPLTGEMHKPPVPGRKIKR